MTTEVKIENIDGPDAVQVSIYEGNAWRRGRTLQPGESECQYLHGGVAIKLEEVAATKTESAPVLTEMEIAADEAAQESRDERGATKEEDEAALAAELEVEVDDMFIDDDVEGGTL